MILDHLLGTARSTLQRAKRSRWARQAAVITLLLPLVWGTSLAAAGGFGQGVYRYAMVIFGFSLIIFFHELGHFIVARLCSVKCEVFSIGIGPRMVGWQKGLGWTFGAEATVIDTTKSDKSESKDDAPADDTPPEGGTFKEKTNNLQETLKKIGETDYRISWLPFGGYVRMLGQDDMDPTAISNDPRAFNRRPIWQRMCIVSAGVIMNLIFAAVVFAIVFRLGVSFPPSWVGGVAFDSPAERAGLKLGDEIVAIDGYTPSEGFLEFSDLYIASALAKPDTQITLDYRHAGEKEIHQAKLTPIAGDRKMLEMGIMPPVSLDVLVPDTINPEIVAIAPPFFSKLRPGDIVAAVDDQPISSFADLYQSVQASNGRKMKITLTNDHQDPQDLEIEPDLATRPGVKEPPAVLGLRSLVQLHTPKPKGAGAAAGLADGDIVTRIGAIGYPTAKEFMDTLHKNASQQLNITVLRGKESVTMPITPAKRAGKQGDEGYIDVPYTICSGAPVIAATDDNTGPLGGIVRGSRILRMNGQEVQSWDQVLALARALPTGSPTPTTSTTATSQPTLQLELQDPQGNTSLVELAPTNGQLLDLNAWYYVLGVPLKTLVMKQESHTVAGAIRMGLTHTEKFVLQTYLTIRGLFLQTVPTSELHGPLGIGKIGYEVQEKGNLYLLYILAVVSVNLAVANFLPLPIVDGGLFLMLILEKIRGQPLPAKVLNAINMTGLCLLGGLFLYVTVLNDLPMFFGAK